MTGDLRIPFFILNIIVDGEFMLSTQYRLRLEGICKKIANNDVVELSDMIWAEKLAKAHTTARDWLRQARSNTKENETGHDNTIIHKMG